MVRYKVTMICKEIYRATTKVESTRLSLETIKDVAWSRFDNICSKDLEQENYTKVEKLRRSKACANGEQQKTC